MQQLFFHIVLFFLIFKTAYVQALVPNLPDDFSGINTENYVDQLKDDENYVPSMAQTGGIMFELGRYFNQKYPDDEIFSDDYEEQIISDLHLFLPNESNEQLRGRLGLLRNSVKIYRAGKKIYGNYVEQKIVPHDFRKVHAGTDYDHDGEFSYINTQEGEFAKIYNFKKFLSYSDNPEERAAIREFEQKTGDDMSVFDKIDYMYRKIEWRKLPAYGRIYKNPLLSDLGVGEWVNGQNVDARLFSPEIYTNKKESVYLGVHLLTNPNYFILANDLSRVLHRPLIALDGSENVKNYEILYPIPLKSNILDFAHKYFGDFVIPLKIELENPKEPLNINAGINLVACDSFMQCNPEYLNLELKIDPKGREILPNGLENFFNMAMQTVPQESSREFSLSKAAVDEDDNGQVLRLEFKTNKKVRNFKVFVEQKDGYAKFDAPLISVRDGVIYAIFKQFDDGNQIDLRDKEFVITAELNNKDSIRVVSTAKESSPFDSERKSLSLAIVFLAFIGGIILNFMPCVFPVLSLKIMALSRVTARKRKSMKRAIIHTVYGIWSGFILIIILLCALKYLGQSLGWGMQFQNMGFLVAMIFVISAFIIVLPYLNLDRLYRYTVNVPAKWLNYGIGFLTVLLATPCTGPYMATAVGFALTGSYFDLIIILSFLALGLSAPYLLIYCLSKPEDLFPKSGPWLLILQAITSLLLYITLIWFMVLLWRQTDWQTPIILAVSIIAFMVCFKFYLQIIDYLGRIIDESVSEIALKRAKNVFSLIMGAIFIILLIFNMYHAQGAYRNNLKFKSSQVVDEQLISQKLAKGKSVLLVIKADWCLTCQYNQAMVLTGLNLENWQKNYNLEVVTVDWSNYNKQVLDFMEKYGRKGLPFYVLFTPILRDGIVLPEIFSPDDLTAMLINSSFK